MIKLLGKSSAKSRPKRSSFALRLCMRRNANYSKRMVNGSIKNHGYRPNCDSICSCNNTPFAGIGERLVKDGHHAPCFRLRMRTWRRTNATLLTPHSPQHCCDDDVSDGIALLDLQKHQDADDEEEDGTRLRLEHWRESSMKEQRSTGDDNGAVCAALRSPKECEKERDSGDDRRKRRIWQWRNRVKGALASLGKQKGHSKSRVPGDVPKGCVGVYVGVEQRRFVVPVLHLNHPLFAHLLHCMHQSYGLPQPAGPLVIPCDVSHFQILYSQIKHLTQP